MKNKNIFLKKTLICRKENELRVENEKLRTNFDRIPRHYQI